MKIRRCQFSINNRQYSLLVESKDFKKGKNKSLFNKNLFNNKDMLENGFIIESFHEKWFNSIKSSIEYFIVKQIRLNSSNKSLTDLKLEDYHKYVDDETHLKIVNSFRGGYFGTTGIDLSNLGINYKIFDNYINDKIESNFKLSCVFNLFGLFKVKKFWIRIVRPNKKDNNPPHRDTHLRYFKFKDNVNIYLPLAGSNAESSLPLIPRSHLDTEDKYVVSNSPCLVNGVKFIAPCIIDRQDSLNMLTPNPKEKEIMIFTPNIVHGGGINNNDDITRVSLEMRFFT